MDEPTSMLDSENEIVIIKAFDYLFKDRTTIIVSHRLSTIQDADNILYMEEGKILEQGNHSNLMSLNGKYSLIYKRLKEASQA